jgi:hypothetical protein
MREAVSDIVKAVKFEGFKSVRYSIQPSAQWTFINLPFCSAAHLIRIGRLKFLQFSILGRVRRTVEGR